MEGRQSTYVIISVVSMVSSNLKGTQFRKRTHVCSLGLMHVCSLSLVLAGAGIQTRSAFVLKGSSKGIGDGQLRGSCLEGFKTLL